MIESTTLAVPEPLRSFERSLPMALLKARESVMQRFRPMLRANGLTEQQWRVLRALAAAGQSLRPMDMAQRTLISMPSLSRLLKTLEHKGLINRGRFADDLRGSEFGLTDIARAMVQEIAPESELHYADIETLVGQDELEQLYRLLSHIEARLGAPQCADLD